MSKDIDEAKDAFKFNFNLQEKLVRLKIAIQSSTQASGKNEASEEKMGEITRPRWKRTKTVVRIRRADRFHQIGHDRSNLKNQEKLPHSELINEVVAKLQFPVNNQDLKKRIESLIDAIRGKRQGRSTCIRRLIKQENRFPHITGRRVHIYILYHL